MPLQVLQALTSFPDEAFRGHLPEFFPILTKLIRCVQAPTPVNAAVHLSVIVKWAAQNHPSPCPIACRCSYAPQDVQAALSDLFLRRLGPMLPAA